MDPLLKETFTSNNMEVVNVGLPLCKFLLPDCQSQSVTSQGQICSKDVLFRTFLGCAFALTQSIEANKSA